MKIKGQGTPLAPRQGRTPAPPPGRGGKASGVDTPKPPDRGVPLSTPRSGWVAKEAGDTPGMPAGVGQCTLFRLGKLCKLGTPLEPRTGVRRCQALSFSGGAKTAVDGAGAGIGEGGFLSSLLLGWGVWDDGSHSLGEWLLFFGLGCWARVAWVGKRGRRC
jgi:hypothetical protein